MGNVVAKVFGHLLIKKIIASVASIVLRSSIIWREHRGRGKSFFGCDIVYRALFSLSRVSCVLRIYRSV